MLLRSIRAHLASALTTLVLAAVVTAGAFAVVGAARAGDVPAAIAAMLPLYGVVALAEQTARATAARAHDVALARLRGLTGTRLVLFAAGPLLTVSLIGVVVGAAVGYLLAGRLASRWHASYALGGAEVGVAVGILAGAWVTVALVASAVVREPLSDALSVRPRRSGTPLVGRFLEILAVAAAVLAVYEARRGGHGWVPVVAPALVALAAGQVVAWLLLLTPRAGDRLGVALTTRRLRRDPAPASLIRILVAATVLLAVTLTGVAAASGWRDDSARLRTGGPVQVPFRSGALSAYAASLDADPDGRWLMAAVSIDDLRPAQRRVYVASSRWRQVVGDYFGSTGASDVTGPVAGLGRQRQATVFHGTELRVHASRLAGGDTARVVVGYVDDRGFPRQTRVELDSPGWGSGTLKRCEVGCVAITGRVRATGSATLDRVEVGSTVLSKAETTIDGGSHDLPLAVATAAQQVLATPGLSVRGTVDGLDGVITAAKPAGTVAAVPLLGHEGRLLDLGRALLGARGSVPAAVAVVVARDDTPASVLATLRADGGGAPTSYGDMLGRLRRTPEARADDLALLVALGAALIALTHLVGWLAGQVRSRRAEVAGLRVAGVRPAAVRSAYVVEAGVLAGVVVVASAVAAAATTHALLRPLRLVGGWSYAPPVDLSLKPWLLVAVALGVAVVTALACAGVFTRFGRSARPSALRSSDR